MTRIHNITLIAPDGLYPNAAIDFEGGKITAVHTAGAAPEGIDGKGAYACPGFVDIHVHGGGNVDFMGATPAEINAGIAAHAACGTTTILPPSKSMAPGKI